MLHLIYQSPLEPATLQRIASSDSVLFMENSLFRLLKTREPSSELSCLSTTQSMFVLQEALETRGIDKGELMEGLQVINYQGFVKLTTEHSLIKTWN